MRSFNIFTVLTALAATVAAYTTPTHGPEGNPIGSPLEGEIVPVGKPYNLVWTPDRRGEGTVTLVLLRGPSTNVQPMYAIVEKTPNTGSYIWIPSTDLESDTTHYAIQLIEDATGRFQWGMQFGIDNPDKPKGSGDDDDDTTSTATDDAMTTTVTATSTSTAIVTVTGTKPAETETETETLEETTSTMPSNFTATLVTSTTKAAETTELETTSAASNATSTSTMPAVPTKSGDEEGAATKMGASVAIVAVAAAAFAFF